MARHLSPDNRFVLVAGRLPHKIPACRTNPDSHCYSGARCGLLYSAFLQPNIHQMAKSIIMKRTFSNILTLCLIAVGTLNVTAQTNSKTVKTRKMETTKQNKEVVQGFFNAFGQGDFNGILNAFHEQCKIVAVRDAERKGDQIYGTYHGKDGVKAFLSNLGNAFDTKAFSVDHLIGEGNLVFANGKFTHVVKASGKTFSSAWTLMCIMKDGKILEYHFYEDSDKFTEANR